MDMRICAADDCNKPYDPVLPEQLYCSPRCSTRMRMRRKRERDRQKPHGGGPGGGPGGNRQPRLFSRSELHLRKPAKAARIAKPKTADLFPADGIGLFAGAVISYAEDGRVSAVEIFGSGADKHRVASILLSSRRSLYGFVQHMPLFIEEAPLAA